MKPSTELHAPEGPVNSAHEHSNNPRGGWRAIQGWPTLLGLAFAAFVALDMVRGEEGGHELASIVAASALVYLAASALAKPSIAWPAFFGTVVVITAAKLGFTSFDATWALLALAALFVGFGLLRSPRHRQGGLPLQSAAMLVFGAVAGAALFVDETLGAYLVAAGLLAHAGWDAYHHRANKVVSRSLAEFCFVLDVALALAIIAVTAQG